MKRLLSEGPMPRHLLNRIHWDAARPAGWDSGTYDGRTGLCGARDVMATRTLDAGQQGEPVSCRRCLALLREVKPW